MKPDMIASNTTEINPLPAAYSDNQFANPSSLEEDHDSYLHCFFPDPFLDDDDLFLSHFLSQQQQHHGHLFSAGDYVNCNWEQQEQEQEQDQDQDHWKTPNNNPKKQNSEIIMSGEGLGKMKKCNRKIGKKDRHSKICTAQGPRDRRMRLSLQIARKFFDLQDMLGFDKASNTIEWLLSHSNSAIKQLKDSLKLNNNTHSAYSYGSLSSGSGSSEVVSEVITRDNNVGSGDGSASAAKESAFMGTPSPKDKKGRQLRTVGRESRDRARARARERTKEKLIFKNGFLLEQQQPMSPTISDLQDLPSIIHSFCSGNTSQLLQNPHDNDHDHDPTLISCPNSIFIPPLPKPYNFSSNCPKSK